MVGPVYLSEAMVNSIGAGLDLRLTSLEGHLKRMREQGADQFDIEVVLGGIQETIATRLAIIEAAEAASEYPPTMTVDSLEMWAPGELTEAYGR